MPNLTVDDALKEYPDELRAVLIPAGFRWNFDLDAEFPLSSRRLCMEAGCDRNSILAALLAWLAGKQLRKLRPGYWDSVKYMPEDPLRWLLEEVRELLKQEETP